MLIFQSICLVFLFLSLGFRWGAISPQCKESFVVAFFFQEKYCQEINQNIRIQYFCENASRGTKWTNKYPPQIVIAWVIYRHVKGKVTSKNTPPKSCPTTVDAEENHLKTYAFYEKIPMVKLTPRIHVLYINLPLHWWSNGDFLMVNHLEDHPRWLQVVTITPTYKPWICMAIWKGNNPIFRGLTITMAQLTIYKYWDDPPSTQDHNATLVYLPIHVYSWFLLG